MSFDSLIYDLKVLISVWHKRSGYMLCLEMLIHDKLTSQKGKKGDKKRTNNTKKMIFESSTNELKQQSRSLLKKSYQPTWPSTYIKEKELRC